MRPVTIPCRVYDREALALIFLLSLLVITALAACRPRENNVNPEDITGIAPILQTPDTHSTTSKQDVQAHRYEPSVAQLSGVRPPYPPMIDKPETP